jgi:hypothetical protein
MDSYEEIYRKEMTEKISIWLAKCEKGDKPISQQEHPLFDETIHNQLKHMSLEEFILHMELMFGSWLTGAA